MPIIMQIVCDRCQAVKREVNHWYALTASMRNATLQPLDVALQDASETASWPRNSISLQTVMRRRGDDGLDG
jgi:hypothetical protein